MSTCSTDWSKRRAGKDRRKAARQVIINIATHLEYEGEVPEHDPRHCSYDDFWVKKYRKLFNGETTARESLQVRNKKADRRAQQRFKMSQQTSIAIAQTESIDSEVWECCRYLEELRYTKQMERISPWIHLIVTDQLDEWFHLITFIHRNNIPDSMHRHLAAAD